MTIEAKVIEDSVNPFTKTRLTTLQLRYPRFIHAEFMTHRVFSRNASSCLTGDTLVYFEPSNACSKEVRDSCSNKISIKEFVDYWFEVISSGLNPVEILKDWKVRSLDLETGNFVTTTITNCFKQGKQKVFKIRLTNGYEIKCTENHRLLSDMGWVTLSQITEDKDWEETPVNLCVYYEGIKQESFSEIQNIEYLGEEETYDLEVESEDTNFVANGIVVHNSRAVPVKTYLKEVWEEPAAPIHWGSNNPGMQAQAELTGFKRWFAKKAWNLIGKGVACAVWVVNKAISPHKQTFNRLLEPWLHISVVVTATEWENFFELRNHKDSQPEIKHLAIKIKEAMDSSEPVERHHHLPYVSEGERKHYDYATCCKLSTARCARVSYLTHDKKIPNPIKDFELHDKLVGSRPIHASPTEHQASVSMYNQFYKNFKSWIQYREQVEKNTK